MRRCDWAGAEMNVDRLLDALRTTRSEGFAIAAWSVYVAGTRRTSLGTKDRETGGPHAPLTLAESLTARFKLIWDDGRVSRGVMERARQVPGREQEVWEFYRNNPDALYYLGTVYGVIAGYDASMAEVMAAVKPEQIADLAYYIARVR